MRRRRRPKSLSADPTAWPEGVARHVLAEVDSTNSEAARLAPQLTQPTWIMAHRQTAARGRRGRAWISPEGNFAATLVMRPGGEPAAAALRSFVAALALADALALVVGPGAVIALKWPNDVLLNGGKVAGIQRDDPLVHRLHNRLHLAAHGFVVVVEVVDLPRERDQILHILRRDLMHFLVRQAETQHDLDDRADIDSADADIDDLFNAPRQIVTLIVVFA